MARHKLWSSLLLVILVGTPALAGVFDTNDYVPADTANYWPWGDGHVTRYQLWLDGTTLGGLAGTHITGLKHFVHPENINNLGLGRYDITISASTTLVGSGGLSADDPDSNHGANKTVIYDGALLLPNSMEFSIDVNDAFYYDGSGDLLLDYVFHVSSPGYYGGPTWEAMGDPGESNPHFWRVFQDLDEGNDVLDWGAIRTEITTDAGPGAVPELPPVCLAALGLLPLGLLKLRRRK